MLRTALALLVALCACAKDQASPTDPGAPRACTKIGCLDGLHIGLNKATPWAPGDYVFAFELDGAALTCTGALPLPACGALALHCDVEGKVQIGESGCALPADQHGFSDIRIDSGPAQVQLTISHAGQPLISETMAPNYVISRPNGPGCEPECRSASVDLALP